MIIGVEHRYRCIRKFYVHIADDDGVPIEPEKWSPVEPETYWRSRNEPDHNNMVYLSGEDGNWLNVTVEELLTCFVEVDG